MAELPPPPDGIVLAHFIVSDDVERSRRFYTEVLGGRVVFSGPGGLTYVALSNCWIIINVGGGPEKTTLPPSTSVSSAESARHRPRRWNGPAQFRLGAVGARPSGTSTGWVSHPAYDGVV